MAKLKSKIKLCVKKYKEKPQPWFITTDNTVLGIKLKIIFQLIHNLNFAFCIHSGYLTL